jgi:DNA-directed RNA polymerase subunit RPC12/RpoP
MNTRPCTRCKGKTEPTVLESAAGEADPLAFRIQGMPVLACERGHRQFVSPEFPRWLVEHVMQEDEARLPAGEEKGLIFKKYHCGECGTRLAAEPDHRETFAFEVALRDLGPFRLELTAPVYRCPACAREQLPSLKDVRSRTPAALAQVFRAADIPPA